MMRSEKSYPFTFQRIAFFRVRVALLNESIKHITIVITILEFNYVLFLIGAGYILFIVN